MLGLFRRKRGQDAIAARFDRGPYRQRVVGLVQALQGAPADAAARLEVLRSLFQQLQGLFKDLATAGDRHSSVRRLGEVLLKVEALVGGGQPAEAAINALWSELTASLQAWLAVAGPAAAPPERREGFWK